MTDSNLKAKAEAATAGPWFGTSKLEFGYRSTSDDDQSLGMIIPIGDAFNQKDLDFIAAANPATVLALIAQNDQLQSELTALKAQVDGAFNMRGTLEYIVAQIDKPQGQTPQLLLSVIRSNASAALDDKFQSMVRDAKEAMKESWPWKDTRPTKPAEAKDGSK